LKRFPSLSKDQPKVSDLTVDFGIFFGPYAQKN
jgi:hypothetical protein